MTPQGDLIYQSDALGLELLSLPWWVYLRDRGVERVSAAIPAGYFAGELQLSRDGRQMAFMAGDRADRMQLNLMDREQESTVQLTFEDQIFTPSFAADGSAIYRLPIRIDPAFSVTGEREFVVYTPYAQGFDLYQDRYIVVSAASAQFADMSANVPRLIWLQNWSHHLDEQLQR